ncbi:hypothetical protein RRG08_051772 [Elysia crispata]|uniref:Uncharacterized protein n=1 Tax=Elysia crispata TaxID=231223 RepID=A0AAE1EAP3_9GAST|nr:hypothetical protein RRG08_051772 [Elysia crispata]
MRGSGKYRFWKSGNGDGGEGGNLSRGEQDFQLSVVGQSKDRRKKRGRKKRKCGERKLIGVKAGVAWSDI